MRTIPLFRLLIAGLVVPGLMVAPTSRAMERASPDTPVAALPPLIFTLVPPEVFSSAASPCTEASRLMLLKEGHLETLTGQFVAACDPALDPAGQSLYFSARRQPGETWQIWRLDLETLEYRQLTEAPEPCHTPLVLGDGRLLFVRRGDLYRIDPSAGQPLRLTFSEGRVQSASGLPDGRLLVTLGGDAVNRRLFVLHPDGTWLSPWGDGGNPLDVLSARALDAEHLILTQAKRGRSDGALRLAALADPFSPTAPMGPTRGWRFSGPRPLGDGSVVAAARGTRSTGRARFGLYRLSPDQGWIPKPILHREDAHALQPLPLLSRPTPAVLPSIVKPDRATGYLLIFDVSRSDDPDLEGLALESVAGLRIRPVSTEHSNDSGATVEPAADGSVFLEVPADLPFRLELVDRKGRVISATRHPLWVRPNERRACLGCHVSSRYAPPNRRPQALLDGPRLIDWAEGGSP
jgi:hypothetical protein